MMNDLDKVRTAVQVLGNEQLSLKPRLERGAQLIWSATYFRDEWPYFLRRRIDEVFSRLLRYGAIKTTVPCLCDTQASELVTELLDWAHDFEHFFCEPFAAVE